MADWSDYNVEILDEPFVRMADDDWPERKFSQTARVHFLDRKGNEYYIKEYGFVTPDEVLEDIHARRAINLSHCYVNELSLELGWVGLNVGKRVDVLLHKAKEAFFDGGLNLNGAVFPDGDITFEDSMFGRGDVSFTSSLFGRGNVTFDFAQFFSGDVSFHHARFGEGNLSFMGSWIGDGDLGFEYTLFGNDNISFDYVNYGNVYIRYSKIRSSMGFSVRSLKHLVFDNCFFYADLDFTGAHKIGCLEFLHCINHEVINIRWRYNDLATSIPAILQDSYGTLAERYGRAAQTALLLKENFRKMGYYDDEDAAYFAFKKFRLRGSYWRGVEGKGLRKTLNVLWAAPWLALRWLFLEALSGYGVKPLNAILAAVLVWAGFGGVYYLLINLGLGNFGGRSVDELTPFTQAFYHSAVTFLTIGYGDIHPAGGIIRILSGLEGFAGLFMMSIFTVSFMRKVLR